MIGYAVMFLSLNGAIYHALFIEGASGGFISFLHWPTSFSVLATGLSMTYMKKHTLNDNEFSRATGTENSQPIQTNGTNGGATNNVEPDGKTISQPPTSQ